MAERVDCYVIEMGNGVSSDLLFLLPISEAKPEGT
jgi:hypothetical protein